MAVNIKGNCYVTPKDKESSEARASRFKKLFNRTRVYQLIKQKRYRRHKLSKRQVREAAQVREGYREERERKKFYL